MLSRGALGHGRQLCARRGFSLLELLISISVMSIAGWVFVSFYSSAIDMTRLSTTRSTAIQLAQDQLQAIQRNPAGFVWKIPEQGGDALFPVLQTEEDPNTGNPAALPAAMPVDRTAYRVQEQYHGRFRWLAFGRLPQADAAHYEVTVMVHWETAGRTESIALTSSVPRFAVGGQA